MDASFLHLRLETLRSTQNADGGWGYRPGKQSWLEPTVYAGLALHMEPAADRAWDLLRSWQGGDGAWRPAETVQGPGWGTALALILAKARGETGPEYRRGVAALARAEGAESGWLQRLAARVGIFNLSRDPFITGWPWTPGTASWVEPTALALIALKQAAPVAGDAAVAERIRLGEEQLLSVRTGDGGWNYGSPESAGVKLAAFPETTALALAGLQGREGLGEVLDQAVRWRSAATSRLEWAWLTIALKLQGVDVGSDADGSPSPAPSEDTLLTRDLAMVALEALAAPGGNAALLKTGLTTEAA